MEWPPKDMERKILTGLAEARIIEYHSSEETEAGRVHHITTVTGYEIPLKDTEVAPFALGACAGDYNRSLDYDATPCDLVDGLIAERWARQARN
ncbi:hypothetical protein ACFOVU_07285 [Nocardiopsis sediminis]|uniref:Uncharacterized protein n=1 Tax=Nocardiopsis sediminis TaxID=1778267 RepID=A0ABV8FLD7_9ACTN